MLLSAISALGLAGDEAPWLLIDSASHELRVMVGDHPREVFSNIALGRGGAGVKGRQGDEITPKGHFRIAWVNPNSRFHLFFGFDFPDRVHAERAFQLGRIDAESYQAIVDALREGDVPPQTTPLGGFVGIHGIGSGDPAVHARSDWTKGCVAVTNQQIEALARWVEIGTQVVVR